VSLNPGTRNQILEIALELFRAQGYSATSLRQIAESADLTKAAVYYHFPAKEQIIIELTRPFLDEVEQMVDLITDDPPRQPGDQMRMMGEYLDLLVRHRDVISLLREDPATQHHPEVGQRGFALNARLVAHLAGEEAGHDAITRTRCAFAALHGILLCDPECLEEARPVVLGAAWAALMAPPAGEGPIAAAVQTTH